MKDRFADDQTGMDVIDRIAAEAQEFQRRLQERDGELTNEDAGRFLAGIIVDCTLLGSSITGQNPVEFISGIAERFQNYEMEHQRERQEALNFTAYLNEFRRSVN
jgi:hypothetical protein